MLGKIKIINKEQNLTIQIFFEGCKICFDFVFLIFFDFAFLFSLKMFAGIPDAIAKLALFLWLLHRNTLKRNVGKTKYN